MDQPVSCSGRDSGLKVRYTYELVLLRTRFIEVAAAYKALLDTSSRERILKEYIGALSPYRFFS